jgi:hypothetical protein
MASKEDFPNGARVTVNRDGAMKFMTLAGHSGTVVGRSDYAHCVRVQWDHLKNPKTIRIDLLKRK